MKKERRVRVAHEVGMRDEHDAARDADDGEHVGPRRAGPPAVAQPPLPKPEQRGEAEQDLVLEHLRIQEMRPEPDDAGLPSLGVHVVRDERREPDEQEGPVARPARAAALLQDDERPLRLRRSTDP